MRQLVPLMILAAVFSSGCASLAPTSYRSFDRWFIGEPERDYEVIDLEGRSPGLQMVHAYLLWPAFALRDGVRIGMIPIAVPYYAARWIVAGPAE